MRRYTMARHKNGRYALKIGHLRALVIGAFIGVIFVGSVRAVKQAGDVVSSKGSQFTVNQTGGIDQPTEVSEKSLGNCKEVSGEAYPTFDCTDETTKEKVYQAAQKGLTWYEAPSKTIRASITKYSPKDSCHYPDGNGGCLTASQKVATARRTVACPKKFALGTRVVIRGQHYVCEDRTANWVQSKFGDTFDIFVDDYEEAVQFGRQKLEVAILK